MIVLPWAASCCSAVTKLSAMNESRPEVGSSANSNGGSVMTWWMTAIIILQIATMPIYIYMYMAREPSISSGAHHMGSCCQIFSGIRSWPNLEVHYSSFSKACYWNVVHRVLRLLGAFCIYKNILGISNSVGNFRAVQTRAICITSYHLIPLSVDRVNHSNPCQLTCAKLKNWSNDVLSLLFFVLAFNDSH